MDPAQSPSSAAASYDDVPYDSEPLVETHPDSLATAGVLVGISPAPIETCRVLELGCATGVNLIPIAASLPEARFVGVDASPGQIAAGQSVVDGAGLKNIDLRSMDILELDERFGQFDYIICHGVYSWVPPAVQEQILDICARNLSERGIAYLSYNTYPGWHARGMVRNMLCHHARKFSDPKAKIQQSRALLEFVSRVADPSTAYGLAIKEVADFLRPHVDAYIYHEFLEDVNAPLYFYQFAERLAGKKLKYFGEVWLPPLAGGISPDAAKGLAAFASDHLDAEQYADFVVNRTFRRSMICRDEAPALPAASVASVPRLHIATLVGPASPSPDVRSTASESFRGKEDLVISTGAPLLKAALVALSAAWPATLAFDALWDDIVRRLAVGQQPASIEANARESLAGQLLRFYQMRVVSLHSRPLPLVARPSARPLAWPFARFKAQTRQSIVNLRHHIVKLDEFDRLVLMQLDGQRDSAAIVEGVAQAIEQNAAVVEPYLQSASSEQRRAVIRERLPVSLMALARHALLER